MILTPTIISPSVTEPTNMIFMAVCQIGVGQSIFCIALERWGRKLWRRYLDPRSHWDSNIDWDQMIYDQTPTRRFTCQVPRMGAY